MAAPDTWICQTSFASRDHRAAPPGYGRSPHLRFCGVGPLSYASKLIGRAVVFSSIASRTAGNTTLLGLTCSERNPHWKRVDNDALGEKLPDEDTAKFSYYTPRHYFRRRT